MAVARCIQCQAELPEAGRFCVMCGRRVGHAVRDRSSDRRVYTSVVGHSVPPEVVLEFERHSGELSADETAAAKREITARTTAPPRDGALGELWRSLLWAVVLATLGALVAWAVYAALRRNTPVPPIVTPVAPPSAPRAPISRPRSPSPPPVKPVPGRELVIPVPGTPGTAPQASNIAQALNVPQAVSPVPPSSPAPGPEAGAVAARQNNDIDFVASQHSPQVRACYDRAFRHAGDKAPTGRVELSFVLVDNGTFGQAKEIVTELNLLGEPLVAACLEELVAEWHFPRPPPAPPNPPGPPGAPAPRLRYPFVFTAAPIQ